MDHIAHNGGRFVTILPRSRKEDTEFRDWIWHNNPDWTEAHRRPGGRHGEPDDVWHTTPAPAPSAEGYPIIWVRSSAKTDHDAEARRARIAKGITALDDLNQRLASPRTRLRTTVAVEAAATAALDRHRRHTLDQLPDHRDHQSRPSAKKNAAGPARTPATANTPAPTTASPGTVNENIVARDAASDGMFPLITCDNTITPAEVLAAYRYQPNLERRNHMLKGPQQLAPVFLHTPHRIEALLLCQFLALLTEALIEREIRTAMKTAALDSIPLYPELRSCPAPSAPRILEIFNGIARHHLISNNRSSRSSSPPSPRYNTRSSTCSTSQPTPTPPPQHPARSADKLGVARQQYGTTVSPVAWDRVRGCGASAR